MNLQTELDNFANEPDDISKPVTYAADPPPDVPNRARIYMRRFPYKENRYKCSVHDGMGWPVITSHQTGRTVIFRWNELVAMARLKGIDLEEGEGSHGR